MVYPDNCMKVAADQGVCGSNVLKEAPVQILRLRSDECDASSEYALSDRYYNHQFSLLVLYAEGIEDTQYILHIPENEVHKQDSNT